VETSACPKVKLTASEHEEIERLYLRGISVSVIKKQFNVSKQTIYYSLHKTGGKTRVAPLPRMPRNGRYRGSLECIVQKAINVGYLMPRPCEVCGTFTFDNRGRRKVHAHHPDYSKPLEVMWLCHLHHVEWHRYNKALDCSDFSRIDEARAKINDFLREKFPGAVFEEPLLRPSKR
jgi:hypothetical protein